MYYLLLAASALCISFQFSLTKTYQSKYGCGAASSFFFSLIVALASGILFFALNRFSLRFEVDSILLALGVAAFLTANNALSLVAVRYGDISVYSMFMMLGGMLLPYLYGLVFLNENTSVCGIIGIVSLVVAVVVSIGTNIKLKNKAIITFLYLLCFFLNGLVSIFSKTGRIIERPLPVYDFLIWNYLFSFIFSVALLIGNIGYRKIRKAGKTLLIRYTNRSGLLFGIGESVLIAGIGSLGYLTQLIGAAQLPAVVLYPMVSGGTILLTAFLGKLFFKEKITPMKVVSLSLTVIGTILFMF